VRVYTFTSLNILLPIQQVLMTQLSRVSIG